MKKIGLAIVTYVNNFGSFLQSYATKEAIENLGYATEVINIEGVQKQISAARRKYFISRCCNASELKSYAVTLKGVIKKKTDRKYAMQIAERTCKFQNFKQENFTFSPSKTTWEDIGKYCEKEYSSVLVGSDQLWRPANIEGGYYTLEYVPEKINKIAYATSFGVESLPRKQALKAKRFIPRIQTLSVREQKGKKLVKKLTGLDAKVVCDPTMLLTREQWDSHVGERLIAHDYILCYFLGSNQDYPRFAKKMKEVTGLPLVGLVHCAGYNDKVEVYYDEMPFDVGPFEFINLIKNANYVLTDSFHCCVFSILFEKTFYAFRRFKDGDEMSTNDRLTTLFDWTGLKNRILDGNENIDESLLKQLDYSGVKERLDKNRMISMSFLSDALKLGE